MKLKRFKQTDVILGKGNQITELTRFPPDGGGEGAGTDAGVVQSDPAELRQTS